MCEMGEQEKMNPERVSLICWNGLDERDWSLGSGGLWDVLGP